MKMRYTAIALAAALASGQFAHAGEAEAKKWIDSEFQPSTLNTTNKRSNNAFASTMNDPLLRSS